MTYASICDGIGAVHHAWAPLGWKCKWVSEIDRFPAAVVEHNFGFKTVVPVPEGGWSNAGVVQNSERGYGLANRNGRRADNGG